MESITDEVGFLKSLVKGLASHFGENCEVVLHDLKNQPYESTIVAIENGHVTGRSIGDCGTNLGLELLRGTDTEGDKYNYITQTKDGRMLKSSSFYIRNDEGEVVGSICINFDISDLLMAEKTLSELTSKILGDSGNNTSNHVQEYFTGDVTELLDNLIQESIRHVGKPVGKMTKDDKKRGLQYLDARGALLIKKSADRIAQYYDISKYTLYAYLDQTRNPANA